MKNIYLLFAGILFSFSLLAQTSDTNSTQEADTLKFWKLGGKTALNFSQTSLSKWSAGGENSNAINSYFNVFANYKKDKTVWDNNLDMAIGYMRQNSHSIKTDDKIDLSSIYGQKAFKNWYYSILVNFKTQFANGYNSPGDSLYISKFLAPAYLVTSIGIDYKPNDIFSLFISPLSGKMTIVNDKSLSDSGAFGVEPGKKLRTEFGGYIKTMFKKEIFKNVELQSKLDLFSNYETNPQNIDVNWDVFITMKINKYLSTNLNTTLIYDDDIDYIDKDGMNKGPQIQFKEIFGIGLSVEF